jgi:hypothetical protein
MPHELVNAIEPAAQLHRTTINQLIYDVLQLLGQTWHALFDD